MASPKDIEEKLNTILNAWKTMASDKVFAGMTVEQFEAVIAPSKTTRTELVEVENHKTRVINSRDDADRVSLAKSAMVVASVAGDPNFGPDSSLYEAMGYTRKSERKTGLTRKAGGGTPPAAPKP